MRSAIRLPLMLLIAVLPCSSNARANCIDYSDRLRVEKVLELPDSDGGELQGVAIHGDYLLITKGLEFHVMDASDPLHPQLLGTIGFGFPVPGIPGEIAASGSLAYVATGQYGIQVVDISDPLRPFVAGTVHLLDRRWGDILASGSHAYVGTDSGMQVIDASNPAEPRVIANVGPVCKLAALQGNLLYAVVLTTPTGLEILDIADPSAPRVVGTVDPGGSVATVTVSGPYAYVNGSTDPLGEESYLWVFDASDPSNPRLIGSAFIGLGRGDFVSLSGTRVYVSTGSESMKVVDVAEPSSPRVIAEASIYARDFLPLGEHAYLVSSGVKVLRIADPVPVIGAVEIPGHEAKGVEASGNHAYVLTAEGMQVIDTTNPASPILMGNTGRGGNDVVVAGSLAYVAAGNSLQIFDVSDPSAPRIIGLIEIPAWTVAVSGNHAFVDGRVIDVTDPTSPRQVGNYGRGHKVAIWGNHAYAAWAEQVGHHSSAGLDILDISDAAAPRLIATIPDLLTYDLAAAGGYVYAVTLEGLVVIDATDPTSPLVVAGPERFGATGRIRLKNSIAYVFADYDQDRRVEVIDVSDPYRPRHRGAYYTRLPLLAASDSLIFVAGAIDGTSTRVNVVSAQCPPLAPTLRPFTLLSPVNRDSLHSARPSLRWMATRTADPADSVRYVAVWSKHASFADADSISAGGDTSCTVGPGPLDLQTIYYWRVRASTINGQELWSDPPASRFFVIDHDTSCRIVAEAEPQEDGILITWDVFDAGDLIGFQVYRRADGGGWECVSPLLPWSGENCRYLDTGAKVGIRYDYQVEALGSSGWRDRFDPVSAERPVPEKLNVRLQPNPGTGAMDIVIAHPRRGEVLVQVLDVRGREVAARRFDTLDAGPQRIQWEPRDAEGRRLASGSYYVRVTAGAGAKSIRWMIVK